MRASQVAWVLAVLIFPASASMAQSPLDLRAERARLLAADSAFAAAALESTLIEAIVAPLAPDAVFLAPGDSFVRGPSAARALLAQNPDNARSRWSWRAIRADVSADATRGYTYGYTQLTLPSGEVRPGKYSAYWARQADGAWRMMAYKRGFRGAGAVSLVPPPGFRTPADSAGVRWPVADAAAERERVMATDRAFSDLAQTAGAPDAFAHYVAPDGAQMGGARDVEFAFGPERVRAAIAGANFPPFHWTPEIADVAGSGDLALTIGLVKQDSPAGGAPRIVGKYLTIWRRQPTGEWRFVVD